jgi:hypothetical protein
MAQRRYKKILNLEEGTIIYLKGNHVIAKWEVEKIVDGKSHMFMHGETRKQYIYPSTKYVLNEPLWKHGLRAHPASSILERDWQALQARGEIMRLFRDMDRLKKRLPKLRNSEKMINCTSIVRSFIQELKNGLKGKKKKKHEADRNPKA